MQQTLINIAVVSLIVSLFLAALKGRRDVRLRLWTAGWLLILVRVSVNLWTPASTLGRNIQTSIGMDALLLAACCFIYPYAISRLQRREARATLLAVVPLSLAIVDLAVWNWPGTLALAVLVILRQTVVLYLGARSRRSLEYTETSAFIVFIMGAWMLKGLFHGHANLVALGVVTETYMQMALHFYAYGERKSAASKVIIAGFVAWALSFPAAVYVAALWPNLHLKPQIWNIPGLFVAIGMILAVIEDRSQSAREISEDYRLMFHRNPQPFSIVETGSLRFLDVNQAALDLYGYAREEFLEMKLGDVLAAGERAEIAAISSAGGQVHRNRRHRTKDGSEMLVDLRFEGIEFGCRPCLFVHIQDVSERERLEQQIEHQAMHDLLTGLPNRTALLESLTAATTEALRADEKLVVISADIDHFKRVNDAYGMRVGDAYLERIARILVSRLRARDLIARTGGDEFTIVLTGLDDIAPAQNLIRDMLSIFGEPIVVQGYKVRVPVSIGVAVGPDSGSDAATLWQGAESARKEAKAAGPGSVVWLSAELKAASDEEARLATHLRAHMEEQGLRMVYQPIFGADGMVASLEALLRYSHPDFGQVSPAKLIPIAEESGLIIRLGEWVIEDVCRQIRVWESEGVPAVPVNVNISGLQLMHEEFADRLMATLNRYRIDPSRINLEITESVAVRHVDAVMEKIYALSGRGFEFSIDDFGTGHSSLARLAQFGTSILKIDRSFLADNTPAAHSIVQAIITMAHTFGQRVVAEGVETERQLDYLRKLKCDLYQGYLLSRPVEADQVSAILRSNVTVFGPRRLNAEGLHLVECAS